LAEALGAKEVVVVDGAGHLIMYDQPGRLGTELGMWLSRVAR
jgi:pimeloyl-ACP methyl ester carboxylesterase